MGKSVTVIAKSPAWLVGGTASPVEGLMRRAKKKRKCNLERWDAGRKGGGGCRFSDACTLLAVQLISHLSVLGLFLLWRREIKPTGPVVSRARSCVPVCVFEQVSPCDTSCL